MMRGLKNRESGKWKKIVIFLILTLLFGVLLNSVRKVYKKKELAEEALVRMEREVSELKERSEFLEGSLERLNTEEGLNFEIRKRLNVAKVGESVAIIVEEEETQATSKYKVSLWQKIKDFFGEIFE